MPFSSSCLAPKPRATLATRTSGRAPMSHRAGCAPAARAPADGSVIGATAYPGAMNADAGGQSTAHPAAATAAPISFRTSTSPRSAGLGSQP